MITRSFAQSVLWLSIGLAAAPLGCGGSVAAEQATTASSAAVRAPVAQDAHGPVKIVADALGDVPLTASQRAEIERLATEADARHASARAARKELVLAVAAQVEAGAIDRAGLRPQTAALVAAVTASQPADRAAFERLHAILAPDQRTAFVDALEARVQEHAGEAHHQGRMRQWAQKLNLSDDQRAQIKAALEEHFQAKAREPGAHPWMEAKRRGVKLLEAFKQDHFVLDEVAPALDAGQQAVKSSELFLGMAEAALPVLTPQQRALAAQTLRARAEDIETAGEHF
jgi:Spy/CpxP family protein refolding chaperone